MGRLLFVYCPSIVPHTGALLLLHTCSVAFAPWDDRLLVYSEHAQQVHLRRVPVPQLSAGGTDKASAGQLQRACCEQNASDGERLGCMVQQN